MALSVCLSGDIHFFQKRLKIIKFYLVTVTRSRSAPNGHDLFGNKPYDVAHHFKATDNRISKIYNIWPFRSHGHGHRAKKVIKVKISTWSTNTWFWLEIWRGIQWWGAPWPQVMSWPWKSPKSHRKVKMGQNEINAGNCLLSMCDLSTTLREVTEVKRGIVRHCGFRYFGTLSGYRFI